MKKTTKYFREFWYRGIIVGEQYLEEVEKIDLNIIWPKGAYAVAFYEREDIVDKGKTYKGNLKQIGKLLYHPDSKIETLKQVKVNHPEKRILIENMETNNYKSIIWTRFEDWPQPFDEKETEILQR